MILHSHKVSSLGDLIKADESLRRKVVVDVIISTLLVYIAFSNIMLTKEHKIFDQHWNN